MRGCLLIDYPASTSRRSSTLPDVAREVTAALPAESVITDTGPSVGWWPVMNRELPRSVVVGPEICSIREHANSGLMARVLRVTALKFYSINFVSDDLL